MDRQAVFDRVAEHMLKQNKQSRGPVGCQYRGDDGLKCAIGCLIPDDKYSPSFEGTGVTTDLFLCTSDDEAYFLQVLKEVVGAEDHDDILFLRRLQNVHDRLPPGSWFVALSNLADEYELDFAFTAQTT